MYVKNPINTHQINRIDLSPDIVDCIVFWTKNPEPMMDRLDELSAYKYCFQFTLTGYHLKAFEQITGALRGYTDKYVKRSTKSLKETQLSFAE